MAWVAPVMGAVGGIVGADQARSQARDAEQARKRALRQYSEIQIPELAAQELDLYLPEYLGGYDPTMEEQALLGESAMEGIALDPQMRQAQMQALQQLAEIGQAGLTPEDMAAMRSMQRQVAGSEQSRQADIMQDMARRGMGGSGLELAARLSSSQAASQRESELADQLAQQAQARALQGITQAGTLGGQLRSQEFGEQSDIARAKDVISQFNVQNQQQVRQRNIEAQRQAQLRNLQEQQRLSEQAMGIKNYQQEANKGLLQNQFSNQMQLAAARAGQYGGQATAADAAAGRTANMWAGIGQGVGQGVAAMTSGSNKRPQTPNVDSYGNRTDSRGNWAQDESEDV